MKCCICNKTIKGYGNDPNGHLYLNLKPIYYNNYQRCCDLCLMEFVIPGRILLILKKKRFII